MLEFLRNDNLDAAAWEDNAFGGTRGEFKHREAKCSIADQRKAPCGRLHEDRSFTHLHPKKLTNLCGGREPL